MVKEAAGTDKFCEVHGVDGTVQLKHAEWLGMGKMKYDLVEL